MYLLPKYIDDAVYKNIVKSVEGGEENNGSKKLNTSFIHIANGDSLASLNTILFN